MFWQEDIFGMLKKTIAMEQDMELDIIWESIKVHAEYQNTIKQYLKGI
jgi:hypothetical protein